MGKKLKAEKQADAAKKAEEQKRRELEAIEQKRQAEREKLEQLALEEAQKYADQQTQILLNKLMFRCLDTALNGNVSLKISYYSIYLDLSLYLESKGFYFTQEVIERDPIILLDGALKKLNGNDLAQLRNELKVVLESLLALKIDLANTKITRLLQEKGDFLYCEKALLFLSRYLYDSSARDDITLETGPEFPRQEEFTKLVNKHRTFIRKFIPSYSRDVDDDEAQDEDEDVLYILNWDIKNVDEIGDNWFNAINMNWISSKSGKVFFDELLTQINAKTEALSDSLQFDAFEKSTITYLVLDDEQKLKTPIPLLQLLEIFEIFGYKKRIPKADKSGYMKDIRISWKN